MDAIGALGLRDRAKHVAQLMADVDQRVAHTAMKTLEAMGDIEVLTRHAIELLGSKESRDRVRAVYVLLWHPTEEAADGLIRSLDDECENVRSTSARALARLGRKESIPGLIRALECPHPHYIQRVAAELLAELGDPSAAPHIRKAIAEGRLDPAYAWTAEKLENAWC